MVGEPEGKGLLVRSRRRVEDNIKTDHRRWEVMDGLRLFQDRGHLNTEMNFRFP